MLPPWPEGLVVLLPVHHDPEAVQAVVAGLRACGAPVVAIDDGSTDGSAQAAAAAGAEVHPLVGRRGAAAAMRLGLEVARTAGYTRMLTCLVGGAQAPAVVLELLEAAPEAPAITLGGADPGDAGAPSSGSGRWSRWWFRTCTGMTLADLPPRLALYPLTPVIRLPLRRRADGWPLELLVRAAWSGVPVHGRTLAGLATLPSISRPPGWTERWRSAGIGPRLALRSLWPWGLPAAGSRLRAWYAANLSPGKAAAACALGAALGIAPIPGIQMFVAATLAYWLRLNVAVTLLVSNHSFGPMLAVWYAFATALGLRLLTGQPVHAAFVDLHHRLAAAQSLRQILAPLQECLAAWFLGSVLLMPVVALVGACLGYLVAKGLRRRSPPTAPD